MSSDIKQAAVKLFNQEGPDFTIEQLQAGTGVSRATLYRRIGSKEALLKELAKEGLIDFESVPGIERQILDATRVIVTQNGFINTTMEQIARQANLGVATLYRHFKDKDNLFQHFIAQLNPKLAFKSVLHRQDGDLKENLKKLIEVALRFLDENQDLVKILFSWQKEERRYFNHLRQGTTTNFLELVKYFTRQQSTGHLRRDISAEDMAISLNGLLMQYAVYAPIHQNRILNIDEDTPTILKLFLHGVIVTE
ncbi:MAG: TetR family transcriptional regulator [Hyphomicrobiales bacterium]|nr:TetR family transcriptional regulator [Hyphomicrobiales bacterium]